MPSPPFSYEPFYDGNQDTVNESGNYTVNSTDVPLGPDGDSTTASVDSFPIIRQISPEENQKRWKLNYHEAAIYLQEGENNDKFDTHPGSQAALPAYLITHNTLFYVLDLVASIGLLALALFEPPHVPRLYMHLAIHSSLELLCLLVIGLELSLRLKWMGVKPFTRHIRSMIKTITLLIMIAEAISVLVRQTIHFRVTRALRPLFLLDCYYCRGVRRFIRQIIQSLPPILDMLLLLLFFMLIFSILGFYLFSTVPNDAYFQKLSDSYVSLFILLTTANYPDVMLPAYSASRFNCLFFIVYLALELYLLMNLFLAVVYDAFSGMEKEKLKKLWLHEREACQLAFKLLVSKQNTSKITLKHMVGLMGFYSPKKSRTDVYLTFKHMNTSKTGALSLEEFYKIYEASKLTWKPKKRVKEIWSSNFVYPLNVFFRGLNWLVTWKWFGYFIYLTIFVNFCWILGETIEISINEQNVLQYEVTPASIGFVCVYSIEATMKILGLGPIQYFTSGWNIFDFIVTFTAVVGVFLELIDSSFYYIIIIRPLRLLRLFKARKRFRDVLGTLFMLFSRMLSVVVVLVLLFYFFAIIGIECFSRYDMRNCCKNTSVEAYYAYDKEKGIGGYYYLNDFSHLLSSSVTLFELTVVNNWYIIMEGYVAVTSEWTRLYFMGFYIVTMVVMTVVVAFILEAFLFRIQYKQKMHVDNMESDSHVTVDVALSDAELRMCMSKSAPLTGFHIKSQGEESSPVLSVQNTHGEQSSENIQWFRGERRRGKTDFSMKMYADEVQEWIAEDEHRLRRHSEEMRELTIAHNHARTQTI